jgi:hypothetical protein
MECTENAPDTHGAFGSALLSKAWGHWIVALERDAPGPKNLVSSDVRLHTHTQTQAIIAGGPTFACGGKP